MPRHNASPSGFTSSYRTPRIGPGSRESQCVDDAGAGAVDHGHSPILGSPAFEDLTSPIGRAVVHRHHLEVGQRLTSQTVDAFSEGRCDVAAGQQDG